MLPANRRQFLRHAAAAGAVGLLPASVQKALALPANRTTGSIKDIEHVVILMQENRSFDHYFGSLRGVRGFGDPRPAPLPDGGTVFEQPNPGKAEKLLPFRLNTETTSASRLKSLDHSWKGSQDEWNGWDVWVSRKTGYSMGYLNREDLPYYYALADAFTICDAYHCSIFGPTDPNRLYFFSGTSGLGAGNQGPQTVTNNGVDDTWTADMALDAPDVAGLEWATYADHLEDAGVSWKLYQEYDNFGDNELAKLKNLRKLDTA